MKIFWIKVQINNKFIDLLKWLSEKKVRIYIFGGMVKRGYSSNDIDLYSDLSESKLSYWDLPKNIIINGLPVRFVLFKSEPSIEITLGHENRGSD